MKKHRVVKPKVTFKVFNGFMDYGKYGRSAEVLLCSGHPRLGYQPCIYTSKVLSVDNEENPSVIETLNTIYVREK